MCVVLLATFGVTLVRRIVLPPPPFLFFLVACGAGVTRRMECRLGLGWALRLSLAYTQLQRAISAKIRTGSP